MNTVTLSAEFADQMHAGQVRKSTGDPYITHPFAVARTLRDAGLGDIAEAGGNLHDTVEDTEATIAQIRSLFGPEVASLVAFNTEDKTKSWEERKNHTIQSLLTATLLERALVVADKLDNLRALIDEHSRVGEDVWKAFKRGRDQQKWYFENVGINAMNGIDSEEVPAFFIEYRRLVEDFFN
jgi:(p)ppGpp synthase/HD superfamily hydrolase